MARFVGRQAELKQLIDFMNKKTASFIVIKGRRRVGKSRLIKEFVKLFSSHFYLFTGLAPDVTTTGGTNWKNFLDE